MPIPRDQLRHYIAQLPVGGVPRAMAEDAGPVTAVDVDRLPGGLVTGSNLIQFTPDTPAAIKSVVSLSLLAAQRVATNDQAVTSPDQWVQRHNAVLKDLNWHDDGGSVVKSEFKSINVAVHQAIIPFITAALGGAAGAASLIVTALNQLQSMDSEAPWITLFDKQSRRFDVSEYQFTVAEVDEASKQVRLSLVAARLSAEYGRTQALFFTLKKEHAAFEQVTQRFSADVDLLAEMNGDLKARLAALTRSFIRSLPDSLLLGANPDTP